jgi:hypothetical protein
MLDPVIFADGVLGDRWPRTNNTSEALNPWIKSDPLLLKIAEQIASGLYSWHGMSKDELTNDAALGNWQADRCVLTLRRTSRICQSSIGVS